MNCWINPTYEPLIFEIWGDIYEIIEFKLGWIKGTFENKNKRINEILTDEFYINYIVSVYKICYS